ncbi:PstS family phosphate ABC transporter substrate-binding protein [Botrimarina sp.]|uniref:PstS family phosphate ABC transporter substrate-binding protein n=1 Tax=Botrimarina sp. TaxID=2795802 RepID=UPI0032EEDEA8
MTTISKARGLYRFALAGATVLSLAAAGCTRPGESIKIDGSSTVLPISTAAAEQFRKEHPQTRLSVTSSGTGAGLGKFINGEIDICDASRQIKPSEVERLEEAGIGFVEFVVAFDGIAVVVNADNDWVDSISVEQLASLWRPENPANTWSEVDPAWPDEEVSLYGPNPDNGTFDYFTEHVVGEEKSCRSDYSMSEDDNVLVTGVSQDKNSLGYFGFAYYSENADKLKVVPIRRGDSEPVAPSLQTIRSNEYAPLSRPLYIYVRQSLLERPVGAEFVKFYIDNAGDLAKRAQYVPVSDEVAEENQTKLQAALGA